MNVISNSCIGAVIYQAFDMQYKNPFIWSTLTPPNMFYIMHNYDTMNFMNYKCQLTWNKEPQRHHVSMIIDENVYVEFVHYVNKDEHLISSNTLGREIYDPNILDYAERKYVSRVNRMDDKIVYVICEGLKGWTSDSVKTAQSFNKNLIIFTSNPNTAVSAANQLVVYCDADKIGPDRFLSR